MQCAGRGDAIVVGLVRLWYTAHTELSRDLHPEISFLCDVDRYRITETEFGHHSCSL